MTPRYGDLVVGKWGAQYMGKRLTCSIGRGGIGQKHGEGDGVTPVGVFRIMGVRFRPDRMPAPCTEIDRAPIGPLDIWSDDSTDPDYNQAASGWNYPYSHEALHRGDPLYDTLAILDFNWPKAEPGKGSAIFMHIWRKPRHPTEGCVAFSKQDFLWILSTWQGQSRVIIRS